jgi:hypothetical protein
MSVPCLVGAVRSCPPIKGLIGMVSLSHWSTVGSTKDAKQAFGCKSGYKHTYATDTDRPCCFGFSGPAAVLASICSRSYPPPHAPLPFVEDLAVIVCRCAAEAKCAGLLTRGTSGSWCSVGAGAGVPPSSLILLGNRVLPSLTAAVPLWSRVDLLSLLKASRTASDSQPLFMDLTRVRGSCTVEASRAQLKVAWARCTAGTSSTTASTDRLLERHSVVASVVLGCQVRTVLGCLAHLPTSARVDASPCTTMTLQMGASTLLSLPS